METTATNRKTERKDVKFRAGGSNCIKERLSFSE